MGHIGIIAEYNPFHNGHYYQIQKVKKTFPDKDVLVVMSGNYVQRGEPAIINKYIRTKMALAGGADMILELPSCFSTQSAELFARGAVLSLYKTGIIDTICFGAECSKPQLLYQIADLLLKEPKPFKEDLQKLLSQGLSFPKARSIAIANYMDTNHIQEILSKPNNILAIEYIKVIKHYHLPIKPFIIERSADNYHDDTLPKSNHEVKTFDHPFPHNICSATALRKEFFDQKQDISCYIPQPSFHQLEKDPYNKPLSFSDFYPFLQEKLMKKENLTLYQDVSPEFANRLSGYDLLPYELKDLLNELASKNITNTRISRSLLHILLEHKKEQTEQLKELEYVLYFRILGFRNTSQLPKLLKNTTALPIITKVGNYKKLLSGLSLSLFEDQLHADNYYRQVYCNQYKKCMPSEFQHSVIIYNAEE